MIFSFCFLVFGFWLLASRWLVAALVTFVKSRSVNQSVDQLRNFLMPAENKAIDLMKRPGKAMKRLIRKASKGQPIDNNGKLWKSIYRFMHSISLSIYVSICLSVCLSACLPACLPACLSVCLVSWFAWFLGFLVFRVSVGF